MAILYLSEDIERLHPGKYKLLMDKVKVVDVRDLGLGIYELKIEDERFNENEPVVAQPVSYKRMVIRKKFDFRK